jgi:WD40 repeat protein
VITIMPPAVRALFLLPMLLSAFIGNGIEAASRTIPRTLSGHTNSVLALAFSSSGRVLASGSLDTTIKVWDPYIGKCLRTMSAGYKAPVDAVAFSSDGRLLASGSEDNKIKV